MPVLVIEKGPLKGRTVALPAEGEITVGRDRQASGFSLEDQLASATHFRIRVAGGQCWLSDCGSMNGTLLNGAAVQDEQTLRPGDQIEAGESVLSFLTDEEARKKGDPLIGQTVGGYRILERVGRGGMGVVYKATQLSLNREVALKILGRKYADDKTFISMFVQEARSAASMNHPNIVQAYDVGKAKETYYFSMEFMAGGSVQDLLARDGRIAVPKALPMIIGAAKGLEFAEKKKIVHCDIKPDNLMLTEDGMVKIGDLGLSKNLQRGGGKGGEGQIFGTPHFVAPEQIQGRPLDHRTDLYSLGATFYRMVAGRTPFTGETARDLVMKHLKEEAPPLRSVDPDIPEPVETLVKRLMQKEPGARFQSATDLLEGLRQAMASMGAEGGYTDLIPGVMGGGRRGKKKAVAVLVLIVGLAVAGGGILFGGGSGNGTGPATEDPEVVRQREAELARHRAAAEEARKSGELGRRVLEIQNLRVKLKDDTHPDIEAAMRRFVTDYPGAPEAADFGKTLEEIPKLRATASAEAADKVWTPLSAEAAKAAPDDPEFQKRMEDFCQRFPTSPHRTRALEWLEKARAARETKAEAARQAAETWTALKPKVEDLLAQERFGDATNELATWNEKAWGATPAGADAAALKREIPGRASKAFEAREAEAKAHEGAGRLVEAAAVWDRVAERFGLQAMTDRAKAEGTRLRTLHTKREDEAKARIAAADQAELDRTDRDVAPSLAKYQFADVADAYRRLLTEERLKGEAGQARAKERVRDYGHCAAGLAGLVEWFANGPGKGKEIALPAKAGATGDGQVVDATPEGIRVTYNRKTGRVTTKLGWDDFTPEELLAVLRRHLPAGPRTALQRAVCGFVWEIGRDAVQDLEEASRDTDAAMREEVAHYRARFARTPPVDSRAEGAAEKLHRDAMEAWRQADQENDPDKAIALYKQAQDLLERLQRDHAGTAFVRGLGQKK